MRNPIIAALDVPDPEEALKLAQTIAPEIGMVKVGMELFTRAGPTALQTLRQIGLGIFLDLKFHDIPNTVAGAVRSAATLGIDMLTLHTCGGERMLAAAAEAARHSNANPRPKLLGVTVLTSMAEVDLASVGVSDKVENQVERLAKIAVNAGLDGLVCSPLEVANLRRWVPAEFELVTPGIRPTSPSASDDQRRSATPQSALAAGATWLVIGRPIYQAEDPRAAAAAIRDSVKGSDR